MHLSRLFLIGELNVFTTSVNVLWLLILPVWVIVEGENTIRIISFRAPYISMDAATHGELRDLLLQAYDLGWEDGEAADSSMKR
jgi:hypothetical protein